MEQIRPDFETKFPELHRRAYDTAFVILGQRTEAEDLALEALASTYLRWDKNRPRQGHTIPSSPE
ncbi:MAG: hypothetical protein WAV54_15695 [Acidimicrobiales bacterium]